MNNYKKLNIRDILYSEWYQIPIKLLLFFLWPFGSLVYSLFRPASKSSYVIFFLFGLLFAWSMDYHQTDSIDYTNIALRFVSQPILDFKDLWKYILIIYGTGEAEKDIYNILINWVTQQFSRNYHALFFIASIPYMYYMLKSMQFITSDKVFKATKYGFVILFLFVLPKDIFNIQNFRFSTATWIGTYALLKIFYDNNSKYFWLLLSTILIHASFILLFIIAIFAKNITLSQNKYRKIFYVSIPFVFFATDILGHISFSFLPSVLSQWIERYTSDAYQEQFGMNKGGSGLFWIRDGFQFLRYITCFYGLYLILKIQRINKYNQLEPSIYLMVVWISICNFIQIVPVLGERFWNISQIFYIFIWFKEMSYTKYRNYIYIILFSWTYEIFYHEISYYRMVLEPNFYFSNLLSLISNHLGIINYTTT